MNILRTLIIGAATAGAMALATPAQAHDDDRDYHHHHHHHYWRNSQGRVIIEQTPDYGYVDNSNVTVAFGGHVRHHRHHHYYRVHDVR